MYLSCISKSVKIDTKYTELLVSTFHSHNQQLFPPIISLARQRYITSATWTWLLSLSSPLSRSVESGKIPKKTWIGLLHLSFIDGLCQELVEDLDHRCSRPRSADQNSSAHLACRKLVSSKARSLEFWPSPVKVSFGICVASIWTRLPLPRNPGSGVCQYPTGSPTFSHKAYSVGHMYRWAGQKDCMFLYVRIF